MQSFKQYLLESDNYEKPLYVLGCQMGAGLNKEGINAIKTKIANSLKVPIDIEFYGSQDEMIITITLDNKPWMASELKELETVVIEILSQVPEYKNNMYYRAVILKGTLAPNVTIETSHVIGNYSEAKNVSLCGIGKQLKLCNRMEIQNAENISEGGLGILKLKGLVPASSWFGKEPQWLTIIRKYFNTDKNIVACQEELFKNGFDEYAKL